ncbi:exonuclease SbcC, partial [Vibrio sp. 10N.261.45.F1]
MDSIELVQADTLKTIYFQHQDTLLMTDGSIKTLSFDSPAIDEIKTLVKKDYYEFGFKSLPTLAVEMATPVTIKHWLDSLNVSEMGQNQGSEEHSNQSNLTTTATRAISMLEQAVALGCSDIHIEVFKNQTRIEVRV